MKKKIVMFVAGAICLGGVIQAFSPQDFAAVAAAEGLIGFPPVSQFMQFNIANLTNPVAPGVGSCTVQLSAGDGQGHVVKRGSVVALGPGKSTSLTVGAADLIPASGAGFAPAERVELLPAVDVASGVCRLVSSVEIITIATGQTSAYSSK